MTLTRNVGGVRTELSAAEEAAARRRWELRDAEYQNRLAAFNATKYRRDRKARYDSELGPEPGHDLMVGDMLGLLFDQLAASVPPGQRTPEFAAVLAKVAEIRAELPKP